MENAGLVVCWKGYSFVTMLEELSGRCWISSTVYNYTFNGVFYRKCVSFHSSYPLFARGCVLPKMKHAQFEC